MIQFLKKYFPSFILLFLVGFTFTACAKLDVYEKNTSIPRYEWQYNFQPRFDFNISDTGSSYHIFIVLRHTDAYRYNNIWLNIGTKLPGDGTEKKQRFEFTLGNDAHGWEGIGMDDIWEVRKPITKGPVKFQRSGDYQFSIAQVMREDPLANIMSVGVRVEKIRQ
jgi:gliding motility-associated lipoprotein GldH